MSSKEPLLGPSKSLGREAACADSLLLSPPPSSLPVSLHPVSVSVRPPVMHLVSAAFACCHSHFPHLPPSFVSTGCLAGSFLWAAQRPVTLEVRSSPGVGWAGTHTGWASGDGGSPDVKVEGDGRYRGERRGLDGEWIGLPSNQAYYADAWNAGTPDKYWYSAGENRLQNKAEQTTDYDDGWDSSAEPIPSNLDWMRYGHAPYAGSVLSKHGAKWESYPYGMSVCFSIRAWIRVCAHVQLFVQILPLRPLLQATPMRTSIATPAL